MRGFTDNNDIFQLLTKLMPVAIAAIYGDNSSQPGRWQASVTFVHMAAADC
jgi:hypothetical protein